MRRKPVNPDAAIAQGVDYLLREFKTLQRPVPTTGTSRPASGAGPIEVSYLVASADARSEIRDVADFVCDGVADEEEINAAFAAAKAAGLSCKVQLSAGGFYIADGIICDSGSGSGSGDGSSWLEGAGIGITNIYYDDGDWPAGTSPIEVVDWHGRASNFSIIEEGEEPV